jgi:hypothetical protein
VDTQNIGKYIIMQYIHKNWEKRQGISVEEKRVRRGGSLGILYGNMDASRREYFVFYVLHQITCYALKSGWGKP